MGRLVTVVGNSGAGKTLLTRLLCEAGPFQSCYEQHKERPFQSLFMQDLTRYALPNQFDYLLLRAEQEQAVRRSGETAVQDGGLDLDFHLYTRYFYKKGYVSADEFDLCRRFYDLLRGLMPPPDLVIYLDTPVPVLAERRAIRNRSIDIARTEDLDLMQDLLDEWLPGLPSHRLVRVDAGNDLYFAGSLAPLVARIRDLSAILPAGSPSTFP